MRLNRPVLSVSLLSLSLALPVRAFPAPTASASSSSRPPVSSSSGLAALTARLDALLDSPPLDRGFAGAMVVSARTGEVIYERNGNRRFMPASNTKLFTTAAALHTLDPERRFETRAVLRGSRGERDGEWDGDLLLVGGGDPSLTLGQLEDLAREAAASGIRRVHGDLVTDASLFTGPTRGPGWGWDWESDDYAAPASALTVERGRVTVTVTPGRRTGDAPFAALSPAACGLTLDNRATSGTAGSKDSLSVVRRHAASVVEVTGSLPVDGPRSVTQLAVEDPAELAGRTFRAALEREGVTFSGRIRPAAPEESVALPRRAVMEPRQWLIARHESAPVRVLLREMNLPSDNHYAEIFLRHVGNASFPPSAPGEVPPDTVERGLTARREYLASLDIPDDEAHLVDGSGLSRLNVVIPQAVVRLLQAMGKDRNGDLFFGSLPLAGRTGTLRRRMTGTPAEANVRAKTGTLTGATALSGRLYTRTGEPLYFSLLMNQYAGDAASVRAIQDRFCEALAGWDGMSE